MCGFLDDPRVLGPAVFVLVRHRMLREVTFAARELSHTFSLCGRQSRTWLSPLASPAQMHQRHLVHRHVTHGSLLRLFWATHSIHLQNFTFPILITAGFNVFSCTSAPVAGTRYLTQDLSLACETPTHEFMKIVGAAVIGLAGFGIPLTLALTLRRRRNQLNTASSFASLGFLYDGYDVARGRYAFEALVMLRKAGAVMIGNLVTDASEQLTSALLLLINMAGLQLLLRPYAVPVWSALDTLSLVSLLATLALSIMYLRWATPASMCAGLVDDDVLPGTTLSCGDVRRALAATEIGVTVALMFVHVTVMLIFALAFLRLRHLRIQRLEVRRAMLAALAADPASNTTEAGADFDSSSAVRVVVDKLLAASVDQNDGHSPCGHALCCCCRHRHSPAPLRSQTSPASSSSNPSTRRASAAALNFIKRRFSRGAVDAAADLKHGPVSLATAVTQVARALHASRTHQRRLRAAASGYLHLMWHRAVAAPLSDLLWMADDALHGACEVSEMTTARVFGAATQSAARAGTLVAVGDGGNSAVGSNLRSVGSGALNARVGAAPLMYAAASQLWTTRRTMTTVQAEAAHFSGVITTVAASALPPKESSAPTSKRAPSSLPRSSFARTLVPGATSSSSSIDRQLDALRPAAATPPLLRLPSLPRSSVAATVSPGGPAHVQSADERSHVAVSELP